VEENISGLHTTEYVIKNKRSVGKVDGTFVLMQIGSQSLIVQSLYGSFQELMISSIVFRV
jgi:hypothetical protein